MSSEFSVRGSQPLKEVMLVGEGRAIPVGLSISVSRKPALEATHQDWKTPCPFGSAGEVHPRDTLETCEG